MSAITRDQQVLLLIPVGGILLYLMDKYWQEPVDEQEAVASRGIDKEVEFAEYNRDAIFINMLHAEEHLRNVADKPIAVSKGEASCVVKHLAIAEGHADEAISHTADIVNAKATSPGTPADYKIIRDRLYKLRKGFQEGDYSPTEAITKLRDVRRRFESFNPAFDISKCKACSITTTAVIDLE